MNLKLRNICCVESLLKIEESLISRSSIADEANKRNMARGKRKAKVDNLKKWREEQKLLKASGATAEASSSDPAEESVPEEATATEETPAKKTKMSDDWKNAQSVYEFTVNTIKGEPVSLEKYKGFVLLIVNVASKCGLTSKNYEQLTKLDETLREKGLRILAFPCNQFGKQEPGNPDQICEFTKKKNVNFDLFEKINVNGDDAHPLYKYLKMKQKGTLADAIKWNFSKFLVDKKGQPVERYAPTTEPNSLIPDIEKYLAEE